jgi:hypothetical protein
MAEIQARLADGDYADKTKPVPKELDAANTAAQHRLFQLKQEFHNRQFEWKLSQRNRFWRAVGAGAEAMNLSRALMTSLDFSALLRQGGFIALGNPIRASQSLMPMLRSFRSEANQLKIDDEIRARPNARLYQSAGLYLTDLDTKTGIARSEEQYQSRLAKRIPLVAGSQRAFTTFLNSLRADSFDAMFDALPPNPSPAEIKAIATYINVATGRAAVGKNGAAFLGNVWATNIFFAPNLAASRFNLLLNPLGLVAGQQMFGGSAKTTRMIAVEYAKFMIGVGAVLTLGALAVGADDDEEPFIGTDPRSTNFLKMRIGNTFIDPLAGLSQVTTFIARVVSGESVSGAGKVSALRGSGFPRWSDLTQMTTGIAPDYDKPGFGDSLADSTIGRFLRSKLAPVPGALTTLLSGKNLVGDPADFSDAALELVVPLSFNNIREIMEEHGVAQGTAIELLNLLGMGISYRGPDSLIDDRYNAAMNEIEKAGTAVTDELRDVPREQWPAEFEKLKKKFPVALAGQELAIYKQDGKYGLEGEPRTNKEGTPILVGADGVDSSVTGELKGYERWTTGDNGKPEKYTTEGINDRVEGLTTAINKLAGSWSITAGEVRRLTEGLDTKSIAELKQADKVPLRQVEIDAISEELKAMRRKEKAAAVEVIQRAKKGFLPDKQAE